MSWTTISTDFDPEEETKNFGTRHAIETSGKIFDVFTHATVSPKCDIEAPKSPPWMKSRSRRNPDKLALVLDNYLHIFSHELQDVSSVDLKSQICCLEWTDHFLLCGLASGKAQIVHLTTGKPLPAFDVLPGVKINGIDVDRITFYTENGKVLKLKFLDFDELNQALIDRDFAKLQKLQELLQIEEVFDFDEKVQSHENGILALKSSLATTINDEICDILDVDCNIGKITIPKKGHLILALDDSGTLNIICKMTMLMITSWKPPNGIILDMTLLEDEHDPVLKLIFVIQDDQDNSNTLQIRELPSFNSLYELKVSSFCQLLDNALDQENPLFVEGSFEEEASNENLDISNVENEPSKVLALLRIRGICEGNPEARLIRLLARQKFQDAETFAKNNNLPLEEVYRTKCTFLVNKLACNAEIEQEEIFLSLKECLAKITDQDFVVQCCLNATFKDLKMTRQMLKLARKNLNQDVTEVNKALHRLDTFVFVHGLEHDLQSWIHFAKVDMLEELKNELEKSRINQALIIWNRHQTEFQLDPELIVAILASLPSSAKARMIFLARFIPDSLALCKNQRELSEVIELLSKWVLESTTSLEAQSRSSWPQIGIDFARSMLEALEIQENVEQDDLTLTSVRIPLLLQAHKNHKGSSLNKLMELINTLEDLKRVHQEFRIRVKLNDFDIQDKSIVTHLLLDWCTGPDDMKRLLDGFLLNYFKKFHVDIDEVLCNYVFGLVEQSDSCWYWNPNECAPWEPMVLILIKYIKCNSLKLDVILSSLRQAPVPWSSGIKSLASLGQGLDHPKAILIQEQENLVIVKQMVAKYQAGNYYRRRGREAERLLQRIFKVGEGQEAFEDAMKAASVLEDVEEVDAKYFYVEKLLHNDDHKEALKALGNEDAVEITERILVKAEVCDDIVESTVLFLQGALVLFKECEILKDRILNVKNKYDLNTRFQFSFEDMANQPVSLAVTKMIKVAELDKSKNINDLINEYSKQLDGKSLHDLKQVLMAMEFNFQALTLFKHDAQVNSSTLSQAEDEDLNKLIKKSSWTHWIEKLRSNAYDKSMFQNVEEEQDLEMINFDKKLQTQMFRDKGLPLDQDVVEKSIEVYEASLKFKDIPMNEMDCNVTAPEGMQESFRDSMEVTEEDFREMQDKIQEMHSLLMAKNQAFLAFKMIKMLEWPLINYQPFGDLIKNLLSDLSGIILNKCLLDSKPDLPFALSLLSGHGKSKACLKQLQKIASTLRSNEKLTNLARLGARYCSRSRCKMEKDQFVNLLLSSSWATKLNMNGLDLVSIEPGSNQHLNNVPKFLNDKADFNEDIIIDLQNYGKAFHIFPISNIMELFVEFKLGQSPCIKEETLVIIEKALALVPEEDRTKLLQRLLETQISPYDYEILQFVLQHLEQKDKDPILTFLQDYKRVSAPSDDEVDQWVASRTSTFPMELARRRLPFHPLFSARNSPKDMFNLLTNELTIDTYDKWLSGAKVFKLGPTNVRAMAAQNTISGLLSKFKTNAFDQEYWYTEAIITEEVLEKVLKCIEGIPDLIKSCALASWVAYRLPKGDEKLLVTRFFCARAEQRDNKSHSEDSIKALTVSKQMKWKLEVEKILHSFDLQKSAYLSLVHQGKIDDLIRELFAKEFREKDVNQAALEISNVINDDQILNLTLIKYSLLDQWLPEDKFKEANLDESTMMVNFNLIKSLSKDPESNVDQDNYWRCVYILQGFASELAQARDYLLQVTFSNDPKWTTNHKLRALKCLLTVVGNQALEESIGIPSAKGLEQRFQSLILIAKLEQLNLPFHTIEAVEATDRLSLIESILRSCGHLSQGIALVVDLCTQHEIFQPVLWSKLLQRLLTIGHQESLKHALLSMNKAPSLWHCPEFHQGWKKLTFEPFFQASDQPSKESVEECMQSLKLVQSCPIASEIGIEKLVEECRRLGLNEFLALIEPVAITVEKMDQ